MDEIRFRPPKEKGSAGLVEGKVGKAVRFRFEQDARSVFFTSDIHGTPEWDRAAGFSFWVKGDGADGFGGLQFIHDDDYAVRYDLCFPVEGTDWTKVTVAWQDLIPVLPGPKAKPLGTPGGNPPSKLSGLWFGKWWYWGDYPAITFAIDELRLEPTIDRDAKDHRPDGPPLGRVRARLEAGEPVTVVTMGDSLTDKRHWANREVAWVDLLKDRLKEKYGSEVTIVNPAIGGTQLRQNLVLMPRWLDRARAGPRDDLLRRQRLGRRDAGRGVPAGLRRRRGPRPPGDEGQGGRADPDDEPVRRARGRRRRNSPRRAGGPPATATRGWRTPSGRSTPPARRTATGSSSATGST